MNDKRLHDIQSSEIVPHSHNGQIIAQRTGDGYINATAMCKAIGKEWSNYRKNDTTESFLEALERSLRIRRDQLILSVASGPNDQRGTWVHPQIAINLATWLSPDFAVQVSEWVVTWLMGNAKRKPYPDFASLDEDEKRLYLCDQVTASNKKLADAARGSGVVTSQDFSIFQTYGYQGMYAGRGVKQIKQTKGLPQSAQILDHMGSAELAANLFRITQTEEALINKKITNKYLANTTHYEVGARVRKAMMDISGIPPESLPVAPDVKKLQKQINKTINAIPPTSSLTADESANLNVDHGKAVNLQADLWKYALLVMATKPGGAISTAELISELPNYFSVPSDSLEVLTGRKDSKFSQLVRNLKSHKTAKTNFIFQGYAEDMDSGFRITQKGRDFVNSYFS